MIVPRRVFFTSWIRRSSQASLSPSSTRSSRARYTRRRRLPDRERRVDAPRRRPHLAPAAPRWRARAPATSAARPRRASLSLRSHSPAVSAPAVAARAASATSTGSSGSVAMPPWRRAGAAAAASRSSSSRISPAVCPSRSPASSQSETSPSRTRQLEQPDLGGDAGETRADHLGVVPAGGIAIGQQHHAGR